VITLASVTNLPILAVYLDYAQYPLGGVLVVTSSCVENYDCTNSSRVCKTSFDIDITSSDFNPIYQILALGFKDGSTKILACDKLITKQEFPNDSKTQVTAVNVFVPFKVLVGYQDGVVREYNTQDKVITRTLSPLPNTIVSHICIINKGELILVGYNESDRGVICGYRVNEIEAVYTTSQDNGTIMKMTVIEEKEIMITLSSQENTFGIFNSSTGEVLVIIKFYAPEVSESCIVTDFSIVPITQKLFKFYTDKDREESEGDIIVMITKDGDALTGTVAVNKESKECVIKLHKIYKGHSLKHIKFGGILSFCIDPVTDKMLIANITGTINIIDNVILWILSPQKAENKDKEDSNWMTRIGFVGFDLNKGVVPLIKIKKIAAKKSVQGAYNATIMGMNNEENAKTEIK
jgi:WD40 repeat protein